MDLSSPGGHHAYKSEASSITATITQRAISAHDSRSWTAPSSPGAQAMDFQSVESPCPASSHKHRGLASLPNKILYRIRDFAHPADWTSLALTSHKFCNTLGTKNLQSMSWQPGIQRIPASRFLRSLQRDLKENTACLHCLKLHWRKPVEIGRPPYPF
jgi:hypothetical protein